MIRLFLGALTHCLAKPIKIFSRSFPDVEIGKEYKSDGRTILQSLTNSAVAKDHNSQKKLPSTISIAVSELPLGNFSTTSECN